MSKAGEKCQSSSSFDLDFTEESSLFVNATRNWTQGYTYAIRTLLTSVPLAASDLLAFMCAMLSAHALVWWFTGMSVEFEPLELMPFLSTGLFLTFLWFGLYPAVMMKPLSEFRAVVVATTLTFVSYLTMAMNFGIGQGDKVAILVLAWLLCLMLLPAGRSLCRSICSRFPWWGHHGLVVGQGEDAHRVLSFLEASRRLGLRPTSVIDNPYSLQIRRDLASQYPDHWLVFAGDPDLMLGGDRRGRSKQKHNLTLQFRNTLVITCETVDARTGDLVEPLERVDLPDIQEINPLVYPLRCRIKRLLDVLVAGIMCITVLPLLLIIAGLQKITSPGPIFYRQARIGQGGRKFFIYKFRTMEVDADRKLAQHLENQPQLKQEWEQHQKLQHDPRITRLGGFLRKTSLDELPQLWNVVNGDMSFVGPRPIVDSEVQRYGESFDLYKQVPPGITGLWQVYGRNKTTYSRRVQLDEYYVQNWSLMLDLYILFRTFKTVALREGAC